MRFLSFFLASLLAINIATAAETVGPQTLGITPVTGELAEAAVREWQISGYAGQVVGVQITAAFDSEITLLDSGSHVLAASDDDRSGLAADLPSFALPAAGTYTIRLRSLHGSGAFSLALQLPTVPGAATAGGVLEAGKPQNFTAGATGSKFYFAGKAKSYLTLDLTKKAGDRKLDSTLILYGPTGTWLAADDGSGGDPNAQIFEYRLPTDGQYTIFVGNAEAAAALTLAARLAEKTLPPPPLPANQRAEGWFTVGAQRKWLLDGRAGQVVALRAQAAELALQLELRDPAGQVLATSTAGGLGSDVQLENIRLPQNGKYTVVVKKLAGTAERAFYSLTTRITRAKK